jgi:glycosyltransferase involved in cell wall biosynthesis
MNAWGRNEPAIEACHVPAISVLIPVRNGERYLDATLASVAAQTFDSFEIIAVDNGSTDGTGEILAEWSRREPRLRAYRSSRPSLHESLNRAASLARAPLIARLDADDLSLPQRLALQYEAMRKQPTIGLLGSAGDIIDRKGRRIGAIRPPLHDQELRSSLPTSCGFIHSAVIMRREAFLRAGGYRCGLNLSEDYDLWLRMAGVTRMANLPDTLVQYRLHGESVTARRPVRLMVTSACVVAAHKARSTGEPEPLRCGTPKLREALRLMGVSRASFRRDVRRGVLRAALSRRYYALPFFPPSFKMGLRHLGSRLRLKPLYLWMVDRVAAEPERRRRP